MIRFNYPFYPMQWYKNKNPVSGNAGQFNYKVIRTGDELTASCWMGFWCMEKTQNIVENTFPLSEDGIEQAKNWLNAQFDTHSRDEIESRVGFLETEPYTPQKQTEPQETQQET